jgi:hypothetical protein
MRRQLIPFTMGLLIASALCSRPAVGQERESSAGAAAGPALLEEAVPAPAAQQPAAFEYSDAYRVRARIHRIASMATLPLFVTELFLGQSLYDNPTDGKKSAHLAVATGIGALFGVNSITGVWNLSEARRDPNGRGRRLLHGMLMLAADAGFLATAALAPGDDSEEGRSGGGGGSRSTHRAVAFTSIGIASAGYVVMLFGGR